MLLLKYRLAQVELQSIHVMFFMTGTVAVRLVAVNHEKLMLCKPMRPVSAHA